MLARFPSFWHTPEFNGLSQISDTGLRQYDALIRISFKGLDCSIDSIVPFCIRMLYF